MALSLFFIHHFLASFFQSPYCIHSLLLLHLLCSVLYLLRQEEGLFSLLSIKTNKLMNVIYLIFQCFSLFLRSTSLSQQVQKQVFKIRSVHFRRELLFMA